MEAFKLRFILVWFGGPKRRRLLSTQGVHTPTAANPGVEARELRGRPTKESAATTAVVRVAQGCHSHCPNGWSTVF